MSYHVQHHRLSPRTRGVIAPRPLWPQQHARLRAKQAAADKRAQRHLLTAFAVVWGAIVLLAVLSIMGGM